MWWKNAKVTALASFVVVFLFYLFIAQFCGYGLNSCGASEKPKA
jgi:vesicle-associated membrane protein 7